MRKATSSDENDLCTDNRLYARDGRPLEGDHPGEFVALSLEGETIVGADDIAVLQQTLHRFGSGNFAFRRIGELALGKWRPSQSAC